MKHKIIKLSFLFLTMSVLTSLREDAGSHKADESLKTEHTCLNPCSGYAISISCKQTPVFQEKKDNLPIEPVSDNEVPLSPISRFILLQ